MHKIRLFRKGAVEVTFPSVMLLQGNYKMDIALHDEYGTPFHYLYDAVSFEIVNPYAETGICRIGHVWKADGVIKTDADKESIENDQ